MRGVEEHTPAAPSPRALASIPPPESPVPIPPAHSGRRLLQGLLEEATQLLVEQAPSVEQLLSAATGANIPLPPCQPARGAAASATAAVAAGHFTEALAQLLVCECSLADGEKLLPVPVMEGGTLAAAAIPGVEPGPDLQQVREPNSLCLCE